MANGNGNSKKAKYRKQRQDDESVVTKAYNSGAGEGGKQTQRARNELTVIGNKIFEANNPEQSPSQIRALVKKHQNTPP